MQAGERLSEDTHIDVLPLRIGGTWFGVEARDVLQVVPGESWMPLPSASALVSGVLRWNGRAVAVVDLGAALPGITPLEMGEPRARGVVVKSRLGHLALFVDQAREVLHLDRSLVKPSEVTVGATLEFEFEGTVAPLLELEPLLSAALGGEDGGAHA